MKNKSLSENLKGKILLFLSEIDFDRNSGKPEFFPQLVFSKSFIRFLYILRQVTEEYKLR